ncbi:Hypothetical predicted protein [Mytilus galloprovincialis]|uniref:Ig-like domain-containing protein n=1 Tax=Mytilus galloprovincialis TaxID=29158 RepID=A0A8B6DQL9_MYTGA|nr:Hypothetical predicted protein [Mytilus galloprovincialis]
MVFMEIYCVLMYLSIFLCIDGSPVSVILFAPQHTPEGQPFQLNCSSNIAPVGQSAEFLINGETLTYVRRHKTMCFNTALGTKCRNGMCRCSLDGRSFAIYHKLSIVKTANDNFTCKMTFPNEMVVVSNAVSVSIRDFPTLIMNSSFHCKGPESVTLVCSLEGTPSEFEFIGWKHSFNGTFVRHLKGIKEGKFFFLLLNLCSYQDAGEYACSLWYKVLKETVTVHTSTTLTILEIFDKDSSLNVFWIMLGVVIVVLVSGLITVTVILSIKRKKQTERLIYRIVSSNGNIVISGNENQYIEPNAEHDVHPYETGNRPYSELVPYQTTRVYETSHGYLEIQAGMDMDTSRPSSDNYEKVE